MRQEPDPCVVYADIIDHPHHRSSKHPQMSLYDRAAQFAPFAALTGYDDMVAEEARLVDEKVELDDTARDILNQRLGLLASATEAGDRPSVSITYFVPDEKKKGGSYKTVTENIKRIDSIRKTIILERKLGRAQRNMEINFGDITDIFFPEE